MVEPSKDQIDNHARRVERDAMEGQRMGHGLCQFLRKDWGGTCRNHCSGSGACDVLRRMGI